MKLPRDVSGADLAKALARVGYRITRQTGSHIRLTIDNPTQQHITIPAHDPLKVGTLAAIHPLGSGPASEDRPRSAARPHLPLIPPLPDDNSLGMTP